MPSLPKGSGKLLTDTVENTCDRQQGKLKGVRQEKEINTVTAQAIKNKVAHGHLGFSKREIFVMKCIFKTSCG